MNEKIKIAIVDDEYLERNLLRNCIDWEKLGMEIVGEASNADEAMGLIDRCRPDIVFTDVNMPITDGLTFSKTVLMHAPDIKIVVVTCFDDFEYAQKSIKIGISDFIVKPIADDEVYKTALKLKEEIEKKLSDNQKYSELRRQLLDNLPYIKEKFYNELIKGEVDKETARKKIAFLGVALKDNAFQVAAIQCSGAEDIALDEEARFLPTIQILKSANNYFKGMIVLLDTMSRIVIINSDENADLYEYCEAFKKQTLTDANCAICIGLGAIKNELCGISASYKEALDALKYKFAVGNNSVILYSNIHFADRKETCSLDDFSSKLTFFVKSCLLKNAEEHVNRFFDSIDIVMDYSIKKIRIAAIEIVSICLNLLNKSGADMDYIYKTSVCTNRDIIMLDTLPEVKTYVNGVVKQTIELIGSMNKHKVSNLIVEVKKYVDENYANNKLSLTAVAKKFFLNPSYLSRTFKKEADVSFVEYITSVRMEKAMSLLKRSDIKVFEIADIVGISDPNYFSNCFKKYTGLCVSDFRKSVKQA